MGFLMKFGIVGVVVVVVLVILVVRSIVKKALLQPFNQNSIVRERFLGIQANTSPLSYAQLDGSAELKCSEPEDFAKEMMTLTNIGNIKIWGGCCGTDNRHMECLAKMLVSSGI